MYRLPILGFINRIFIIALVLALILHSFFGIGSSLVLNSSNFGTRIYSVLTYPLAGGGLFEVIFNSLLLWLIGSDLERLWGRKKYLIATVVVILGSAGAYRILSAFFPSLGPLFGPSGLINFLMISYAILYPHAIFSFMFLIPIKAKYFAFLIIGIEIYLGIFSSSGISTLAHLAGVAAGYFYIFVWPKFKKRKPKGNLYLIKGLKDGGNKSDLPPKYWH